LGYLLSRPGFHMRERCKSASTSLTPYTIQLSSRAFLRAA
jgi:hypothetical protein